MGADRLDERQAEHCASAALATSSSPTPRNRALADRGATGPEGVAFAGVPCHRHRLEQAAASPRQTDRRLRATRPVPAVTVSFVLHPAHCLRVERGHLRSEARAGFTASSTTICSIGASMPFHASIVITVAPINGAMPMSSMYGAWSHHRNINALNGVAGMA